MKTLVLCTLVSGALLVAGCDSSSSEEDNTGVTGMWQGTQSQSGVPQEYLEVGASGFTYYLYQSKAAPACYSSTHETFTSLGNNQYRASDGTTFTLTRSGNTLAFANYYSTTLQFTKTSATPSPICAR